MWYRALGPVELLVGNQWTKVESGKVRSLLAILLINSNIFVTTNRILDELWLDAPPMSAWNLVQQYMSRLRRILDNDQATTIVTYRGGYRLLLQHDATDINKFERLISSAASVLRDGAAQDAALLAAEALDLWRGPAFADVVTSPSVRSASRRLEEQRVIAFELWARAELYCGRHAELVPHMYELVQQYPYHEEFWAQLMTALCRSGRQTEALAAYRQIHQLLTTELAVEPGVPLKLPHRRILRGERTPEDVDSVSAARQKFSRVSAAIEL